MGKRGSGWKSRVRVPSQRHFPGVAGVSFTGTFSAARSSTPVTATMGWEKVTARWGAMGTSPSGA